MSNLWTDIYGYGFSYKVRKANPQILTKQVSGSSTHNSMEMGLVCPSSILIQPTGMTSQIQKAGHNPGAPLLSAAAWMLDP